MEEAALDMALAVAGDPDGEQALGRALDDWSKEAHALTPSYEGPGALIGVILTKGTASLLARRAPQGTPA
jgi:hypothetical protein